MSGKACFSSHIGLCPGVCTGNISEQAYRRTIRDVRQFFEGKKHRIVRRVRADMQKASREERFEEATLLRKKLFALEHIKDIALIKREEDEAGEYLHGETAFFGRIEGYDISHAHGSQTVASMVVFEKGQPLKKEYRLFRLRTIEGVNDVASLKEVLMRRFRHPEWPEPDLLLIDGGLPQVHAVEEVLRLLQKQIPVIGMAKGPARKKTEIVCSKQHNTLRSLGETHLRLLTHVRDEAHRFAITYHRKRRSLEFLPRT